MPGESPQLNPASLSIEQAARILSTAGQRTVSPEWLRKDVDAGAPTNADGSFNLVLYAAWLLREENHHAN